MPLWYNVFPYGTFDSRADTAIDMHTRSKTAYSSGPDPATATLFVGMMSVLIYWPYLLAMFSTNVENKLSDRYSRQSEDGGAVSCEIVTSETRRCTVEFPGQLQLPAQVVKLEKAEFPAAFSWYRAGLGLTYRVKTSFNGETLAFEDAGTALSHDIANAKDLAYAQLQQEQYGKALNRASYK